MRALTLITLTTFLLAVEANSFVCKEVTAQVDERKSIEEDVFQESRTKKSCGGCHIGSFLNLSSSRTLFWDQGGSKGFKIDTVSQQQTIRAVLKYLNAEGWKKKHQPNGRVKEEDADAVRAELTDWIGTLESAGP